MSEGKQPSAAVRWIAAVYAGVLGGGLAGFGVGLSLGIATGSATTAVTAGAVVGVTCCALIVRLVVSRMSGIEGQSGDVSRPVRALTTVALFIGTIGSASQVIRGIVSLDTTAGTVNLTSGLFLLLMAGMIARRHYHRAP